MNQMRHIRTAILCISQKAMAEIVGRDQATISRWESGELDPSRREMERIRCHAMARGKPWDDAWFFDPPPAMADRKVVAA
ncbi:hypothetical protein VY88_27075 [Azospirillum thiophilum]|uniref:HTH cro/C1-type domain-containing protein n=1 Tax=Azospirillum thiophilum TaxID=528244 RepID=A0AAC8W4T2_9PROT|nr:helix-turn-helix transcriptional regulator [Azospirillum thiophilum]ALG75169.1 hypothetical protein AL072_29985 [Azospirillum thiophilum]KJR62561.1 hypothetical protein VY88_27075 [Azospirillum thiophilum]